MFQHKELLSNIHEVSGHMEIHCNPGGATTNMVGDLAGYGTVWYHLLSISNILSLAHVRDKGYQVTYDNEKHVFNIHKHDQRTQIFHQSPRGLN
jgi:hypothetical protein